MFFVSLGEAEALNYKACILEVSKSCTSFTTTSSRYTEVIGLFIVLNAQEHLARLLAHSQTVFFRLVMAGGGFI